MNTVERIMMAGYPRKSNEPARARKNWTDEELQYLSDKYGLVAMKTLIKNLQRTKGAIYLATKKLLNHQHIYDNFYTARELARILAVGDAKSIAYWAQRGWLKGKRAPYFQGTYRFWVFTEKNVVRCLRERPWLVNLKRLPEHYFRSIVQEEYQRDPWYSCLEAAPFFKVKTDDAIQRYIHLGWLPAEKKPGGPWQGSWIIRRSAIEEFLSNDPRPEHKHALVRAARHHNLRKEGRPIRVSMVWQFECPRCGLEVKIMAPPKMIGPEVRERFINIYVNSACSHGAVCQVKEKQEMQEKSERKAALDAVAAKVQSLIE